MRVYFNPHGEAPRVWSIRVGNWELAVASVSATGVDLESKVRKQADPEPWEPTAWFECSGKLTVSDEGHAIISPGVPQTFVQERQVHPHPDAGKPTKPIAPLGRPTPPPREAMQAIPRAVIPERNEKSNVHVVTAKPPRIK